MKPLSEFEDAADDTLEMINVGGCCAVTRLLQLRLFGAQQIHDLVRRKVAAVAADASRGEDLCKIYQLKQRCIEALEGSWFCCLHYFKRLMLDKGDGLPVYESLVFCDAALRCWLIVHCDARIDIGVVQKGRDAAKALHSTLRHLGYPVADITFYVYTPVSPPGLPDPSMREHIPPDAEPLSKEELPYADALLNSESGQRAVRDMLKVSKVRLGCDPPPGFLIREGRTVCPKR